MIIRNLLFPFRVTGVWCVDGSTQQSGGAKDSWQRKAFILSSVQLTCMKLGFGDKQSILKWRQHKGPILLLRGFFTTLFFILIFFSLSVGLISLYWMNGKQLFLNGFFMWRRRYKFYIIKHFHKHQQKVKIAFVQGIVMGVNVLRGCWAVSKIGAA